MATIPYLSGLREEQKRELTRLGRWAAGAALLLFAIGFLIFTLGDPNTGLWKLGELLVGVGTIAISGVVVALLLEHFKRSQADAAELAKERHLEAARRAELELDFLRRMRAVFVTLAGARLAIHAEDTVDAYLTGFRTIAGVRPVLEDLETDLKHSTDVFPGKHDGIHAAVAELTGLTRTLLADYSASLGTIRATGSTTGVRAALHVAAVQCSAGRTVQAFLQPPDPDHLPPDFDDAIGRSKGAMRKHIYGESDDTA